MKQMNSTIRKKLEGCNPPEMLFENKFSSNLKKEIPRRAKDEETIREVNSVIKKFPTTHKLVHADSRSLNFIDEDVHLVVTSPPYWTIKDYETQEEGQLGAVEDYEEFHLELNKVWRNCFNLLEPGGRMVVVVGDVCLSRREAGRHEVVPLHSDIQVNCKEIGFENLAPIIWYKIGNISREVKKGRYLGKPYEPNSIIKNDVEYILFFRKPGYRSPSEEKRRLSIIPEEKHRKWFQQIWQITGASTKSHPAPFPEKLAERLVRMFSFVDDTVLDPFTGSGTTNVAAMRWGRNSIGVEIDEKFFKDAERRIKKEAEVLFGNRRVETRDFM